jgi:glycosidase
MQLSSKIFLLVSAVIFISGCSEQTDETDPMAAYQPQEYIQIEHPDWTKNASLYQINTRHFTKEGTFRAATEHLPRLKELGVDILWLMPIHPIGEKNRKGTLGSPYSVQDYFAVNPEFGTLEDLKYFVDSAHEAGFKVILDWVANHTAWDNVIMRDHPDWYERDHKGDFRPTPWWDWSDIIDLDYSKPEVREYMTRAMKYWVEEVNIDGYRADVAGFVPIDFWNNVRQELDAIKPVFMLAEWESRDMHARAFDMTYAWDWREKMHALATGHGDMSGLFVYYSWNESAYPKDALRMKYISNHDTNAWEGTQYEAFGDALEAAIVLSVVGDGVPLIYNGQEAGLNKRLAFFEKDEIQWQPHPIGDLYKQLLQLKKQNTALWNGRHGATMQRVWNNVPMQVLSFVRQNQQDKVLALLNFSGESQAVKLEEEALYAGDYLEYFTGESVTLSGDSEITIPAWSYRLYIRP